MFTIVRIRVHAVRNGVHDRCEWLFTLVANRRSRCVRIRTSREFRLKWDSGGDQRDFVDRAIADGASPELEPWMMPVTLNTPEAQHLVAHFWRLDRRRGRTGFEISPLTYSDFVFYQQLMGYELSAWQIEMISLLDDENFAWFQNRLMALMRASRNG